MMEEPNKEEQSKVGVDIIPKAPTNNKNVSVVSNMNSNINTINLLDTKQLEAAKAFMIQVMRSKKGGISSVEDGLAVLMRAQDLNLPFSTCLEHIHVINGKTGIDIHVIKALLSKAGVTWELIDDYAPLYEYTDGFNVYVEDKLPTYCIKCSNRKEAETKQSEDKDCDNIYVYPTLYFKDYNGNIYKSYQWNSKLKTAMNPVHAQELAKQGFIPVFRIPNVPVDFIATYKLYRTVNGKQVTATGHFSFSEANAAELFSKDNYVKYARIMICHRAFVYAAREIASDILLGAYETTELKVTMNTELNDSDVIDIEAQEI